MGGRRTAMCWAGVTGCTGGVPTSMSNTSCKWPISAQSSCTATLRRMRKSCREMLTIALLLLASAVPLIHGQTVKGIEGQPVTLPCSYKIKNPSDITAMCWGRGYCPNSKCNEQMIWTDGYKVTYRSSNRYQLKGQITRGDVSLTIGQAMMTDNGQYCCRIEHRGWFNDEKFNIQLNMERAPTTTPVTSTTPPPVLKTTPFPTTTRAKTLPPTPAETTGPPSTPEETTLLPSTTLPATTEGTTPESPIETTTSTFPTSMSPALPEYTTMTPTTLPAEWTTSKELPVSASDVPNISTPENTPKATVHHIPSATHPPQPASNTDINGIADHIFGNTTVVEKENTLPLHIIIPAICIFAVAVALVAILYVKLRSDRKRGRYPVGFDPNLELVAHAEESPPEAEVSQPVSLEADKVEANKAKTPWQQNGDLH